MHFWLLWKINIFSWNIAVLLCTWTLSHIILSVCIVPVNQPLHLPATSSFYKLWFFYCSFTWFVRVLYVYTWNIIRPTLYFPPPTLQLSIHTLQLGVLLLTFSSFSFSIPSSYNLLDPISAVQMCMRLWGHPLDHGKASSKHSLKMTWFHLLLQLSAAQSSLQWMGPGECLSHSCQSWGWHRQATTAALSLQKTALHSTPP